MNGTHLLGTPNLTVDQTFHCLNCIKLPSFHWELATKSTLVTLSLLKLMKQDATACLHPCGILTKPKADGRNQTEMCFPFNIELASRKPPFRCQYSASNVTNISLDSRNSISTVKPQSSPQCQ